MKMYLGPLLSFSALLLLFTSCQKGSNDPSPPDPVTRTIGNDSMYVLVRIKDNSDTRLWLTYDSTKKRYTECDLHIWKIKYHYDQNNRLLSEVANGVPAIYSYDNTGKARKIFYKSANTNLPPSDPYYTSITDSTAISNYDSINYNGKGKVLSIYNKNWRITWSDPYPLSHYFTFTYDATDTVLTKVEFYARKQTDHSQQEIHARYQYLQFDTLKNPMASLRELTGGSLSKFTLIHPYPRYYFGGAQTGFFPFLQNNCTVISYTNFFGSGYTGAVKYTYNSAGLPLTSIVNNNNMDVCTLEYIKVKK